MPDHVMQMIEDCQSASGCRNVTFTAWEEEFIESVAEQVENGDTLTKKQENKLRDIWEKI